MRFVTPDAAVMHGEGSVRMPWQETLPARRRSSQTYVVVRERDGWRIAAFHDTRVRPIRLPSGVLLRLLLAAMRLRTWLAGGRPG